MTTTHRSRKRATSELPTSPETRKGVGDEVREGADQGTDSALAAGLYVVATPIGAARDITLRALDVLRAAPVLLAEDTRSLRRLLTIHGIPLGARRLWAYHDHNGAAIRPKILAALAEGRPVALVSEAGTPLVADPGYQLVRAALAAGHRVFPVPGPSAVLAALTVSGLPTDRFAFLGFPPRSEQALARFARETLALPMTSVIFESPARIHRLLGKLLETGGGTRAAALCRELTKTFEEVQRGTVANLAETILAKPVRGEIVLVLAGAPEETFRDDDAKLDNALATALAEKPLRSAVDSVACELGLPRRHVYRRALALARQNGTAPT